MKKRSDTVAYTLMWVGSLWSAVWLYNHYHPKPELKEEAAATQFAAPGAMDNAVEPASTRGDRKPKLTARSVKPSKARVAATEEELDALDAMREGDFQEAGKILDEAARQPEGWLIELRKKWGVTNVEAKVAPGWEELSPAAPKP